jgi:hypothetical protein
MRRLLLDESVPAGLKRLLTSFEVKTAPEMGWAGISNGRLLVLAEQNQHQVSEPARGAPDRPRGSSRPRTTGTRSAPIRPTCSRPAMGPLRGPTSSSSSRSRRVVEGPLRAFLLPDSLFRLGLMAARFAPLREGWNESRVACPDSEAGPGLLRQRITSRMARPIRSHQNGGGWPHGLTGEEPFGSQRRANISISRSRRFWARNQLFHRSRCASSPPTR